MSRRPLPARRQHLVKSGGTELLAPNIDYVLVDSSGSMWDKFSTCMAALDTYLGNCAAANLNSQLIVQVFGGYGTAPDSVDNIQRDHRLSEWVPFSEDPLNQLGGTTPGNHAINSMGLRLRELQPERCSIVIVTDGDFDGGVNDQSRAILDWCRGMGWAVTFIGCDFDNSSQAAALGADPTSYIGVQRGGLDGVMKALADKRKRYQHGDDIEFSEEEKQKFGGYLPPAGGSR